MGFVGGMLGLNGGVNGTGISGPQQATIQSPTTDAQIQTAYNNSQGGIQNQQAFLQAVQAQNGLQNQSNVYSQLQGVANGTGPNPAQTQLNQATGANVANQAALMAGQRGASANPGLIARQAAQQGAGIQQQAAGQAATLQAQQSLNALTGMGNLATNQANQQAGATQAYTNATQGEQGQLLNAVTGQNNARVGAQSNLNSTNAALAGQTMGMQGQLFGGITGGAGAALAMASGGMVPKYAEGTIDVTTPMAPAQPVPQQSSSMSGPKSNAAKFMSGMTSPTPYASAGNAIGTALGQGIKSLFSSNSEDPGQAYMDADTALDYHHDPDVMGPETATQQRAGTTEEMPASSMDMDKPMAAKGGRVDILVSPKERLLSPKEVKKVAEGKKAPMEAGEEIPGNRKAKGTTNSYADDTVPRKAAAGSVVLPNSVTQAKHPNWAAHKFMSQLMAKQGKSLPKKGK